MEELMNFNPKTCVRIPVTTLPREEVLAIFYGKVVDVVEKTQKFAHKAIEKANAIKNGFTNYVKTTILADFSNTSASNYMVGDVDARTVYNPQTCVMMETVHLMNEEERKQAEIDKTQYYASLKNKSKKTIKATPKFTEEEAVVQFQQGVQSAGAYVFEKYQKQIKNFARDKSPNEMTAQEVEGEIIIAFSKCMNTFDVTKRLKFKTYFWTAAQHAKMGYYNRMNAKKRVSESGTPDVSIYAKNADTEVCIADSICDATSENVEKSTLLRDVIDHQIRPCLDAKENKIIDMLLAGFEKGEINQALDITRAGVYNRVKRIREKLLKVFTPNQVRELMFA